MNLIFVFLVIVFGITFFYVSYRLLSRHFHSIISPLNNAVKIFFTATLLGFGLALYNFSKFAHDLFQQFYAKKDMLTGILLFGLLIFLCLCFCVLTFRLVVVISKITIKENEKAELIKGNFLISGFQSVLFLFFIALLSDAVLRLIAVMIS